VRHESSTVVALVGEVSGSLLAQLAGFANVSVARAPAIQDNGSASEASAERREGWERGADAMREAARRRSTYVIVSDDPLAEVAAQWRAMWQATSATGSAGFEAAAAKALTAWFDKRFELPDYYLVMVPALRDEPGPDLYLGPLHARRPHRVAVAGIADGPAQAPAMLEALRSLAHGPWWPPLDELLDTARRFYAGGLVVPGTGRPAARSPDRQQA
jgi:hypothetical protein